MLLMGGLIVAPQPRGSRRHGATGKHLPPSASAVVQWHPLEGTSFRMRILLLVLGGLLVFVALAALVLYLRMRSYLARSQGGIQSTVSEIAEEIDSYQEKTQ